MKKKVLIYPCGTEVGMEMWESLKYSKHFEVFGANMIDCAGFRLYDKQRRAILEKLEDIGLLCELWEIDIVLPAHDQVQYDLCEIFSDDKRFVLPELSTLGQTILKGNTYTCFEEIAPKKIDTFPAFVKPERGQGSRGARVCHNFEELYAIERDFGGDMGVVQTEILEGPEYTVDCFTDRNGALRYCQPRERMETRGGISVKTKFVQPCIDVNEIADTINNRLKMRGTWFFQMKGGKLLEIAPRIAGSSGINRAYGVNLTELTLWDFLGHDVKVPSVEPTGHSTVRRLNTTINLDFQSVYVDIDDTLYFDGKPNPEMVGMLYKWRNEGKHVHLITRKQVLLNRIQLFGLDLPCTHVRADEPKSKYINPHKAIFIDDSFAERDEVRRTLGIPVFGPETVSMLW